MVTLLCAKAPADRQEAAAAIINFFIKLPFNE